MRFIPILILTAAVVITATVLDSYKKLFSSFNVIDHHSIAESCDFHIPSAVNPSAAATMAAGDATAATSININISSSNNSSIEESSTLTISSSSSSSSTSSASSLASTDQNVKIFPRPGYELAYHQSFGFFDDIPNEKWTLLQKRHRQQFPNFYGGTSKQLYKFAQPVPIGAKGRKKKTDANRWYQQNFEPEFTCPHEVRIGGLGDGPKWVCDPHRITDKATRKATSTSSYINNNNNNNIEDQGKEDGCLVYSVGSAGNVMYERSIKEEISSECEIHTFDVKYSGFRGDFATLLQNYSSFHPWGLGTDSQVAGAQRKKSSGIALKTLQETIQVLGHQNRTIDIFKIDCEGCEWSTFTTWLDAAITTGVFIRQILVETHYSPMPDIRNFFYGLHDAGYVIFHKEANYYASGQLVEWGFVKLSTEFFVNGTMYSNLRKTSR